MYFLFSVILAVFSTLTFSHKIEKDAPLNSTASWTQATLPPTSWVSVGSDSTGKNQAALSYYAGPQYSGVYVSSDFGITWKNVFINGAATSLPWTGLTVDGNGQIYALQQNMGIFISYNNGQSWSRTIIDPALQYANYNSVAASGSYYIYVTLPAGAIYVSSNAGYSFTKTVTPASEYWMHVSTCSSGQYGVALSNYVYVTSNYGATWTRTSAPYGDWYTSHFSSDGRYVVAARSGGGIYTSSDSGRTWALTPGASTSLSWRAVTSDASGRIIAAAVSGGNIYYSNDQGKTFTQSTTAPSGENWISISTDATGLYYAVVSYSSNGHLYSSNSGV